MGITLNSGERRWGISGEALSIELEQVKVKFDGMFGAEWMGSVSNSPEKPPVFLRRFSCFIRSED
jgi:hypothetical protein